MKNICYCLFVLISISSCGIFENNNKPNNDYFRIEVTQDGKIIKEKDNIVTLKKKPFKYKLTLFKTDHVYVSNSWGTHYYDLDDGNNIFQCDEESAKGINDICHFVSIKTGNEDRFNADKDIYVGDKSYHGVWFYDESIDWYRMDDGLIKENGIIYAEVTVENIYDLDKRDEGGSNEEEFYFPVEKIQKDIYLVLATSKYEKGMDHPEELQREKIILRFK